MFLKKTKKILVVEDEPDIADNIMVRLHAEGFTAIHAADGDEAVNKARKQKPHLILLDIMLPRIEGVEVCKILKRNNKTCKIPIIMLTSLSAIGDIERALSAGANDYITKPFEYDRLLEKIKKFLP